MGLITGLAGMFAPDNTEGIFMNVGVPDPEMMKVQLEEYIQQGLITPEEAQLAMQDPSAYEQIMSDPALKEAQMGALSGLQDVYEQGGLTANSKARMNDIAKNEGIQQRGAREAILSNSAQKGTSGSGLEFLSQLKNQQESAGRQSDRDTDVAADAETRALEAMIQGGTMAGNIRGQDFSQDSKIADAKDAIQRFNTSNRNSMNMYNTGARNDAQVANLNAKQNIANKNVDMRNDEQQRNKNVYQQQFDNKMTKAAPQAGARRSDAKQWRESSGEAEEGMSDIFSSFFG